MNSVLIGVIVMGIFVAVTSAEGYVLGRTGKPYRIFKLALHSILFLFVTAGLVFSIYKVDGNIHSSLYSTTCLHGIGLTLLANLITGVIIAFVKSANDGLIFAHKLSSLLMAFSVLFCIVFLIVKI